uniref:Matrix metallopeptidase 9 (Gelatinase B, 92kDa gelatinase, 92kDa type IV collagenase) [Taeniopygia guttata] n=1 Tax=Lepeophtheirus salmonis TaxID=72036 RepID=A0A0K2SX46_LEPSM
MKTTCLIVLLCIGSTFADPKNTRPVKTRTTPSVVTSVANECKTTNGVACTFPFMYSGVTYQTCTSAQNNGVDWCATSLHETGEAKNYGNCASNCPGDTNVVTTQKPSDNCETTDNIQCVFPFLYSGASYSHCTTQDNFGVNWCATSLHGSGEAKDYGTCKSDCPVKAAQVTTTAFDCKKHIFFLYIHSFYA